jgi:hypothetical protein
MISQYSREERARSLEILDSGGTAQTEGSILQIFGPHRFKPLNKAVRRLGGDAARKL